MLALTRPAPQSRHRPLARLVLEALEARSLPSANWPGLLHPVTEHEVNDTVDVALDLGDINSGQRGEAVGTIGNSPAGAADVDWYQFTLSNPGNVDLRALSRHGS